MNTRPKAIYVCPFKVQTYGQDAKKYQNNVVRTVLNRKM